MQRRAYEPDSGFHCLEVPPSQVIDLVVDIPAVAIVILSVVFSCCLADEVAAVLVVVSMFVAALLVTLHLALCSFSCRQAPRSSSTTVTCAWQVLLVTMHITLCLGCRRPCDHQRQVPAVRIPVVTQRQVPTVHLFMLPVQFLDKVLDMPVAVLRQVLRSMVQKTVVAVLF